MTTVAKRFNKDLVKDYYHLHSQKNGADWCCCVAWWVQNPCSLVLVSPLSVTIQKDRSWHWPCESLEGPTQIMERFLESRKFEQQSEEEILDYASIL